MPLMKLLLSGPLGLAGLETVDKGSRCSGNGGGDLERCDYAEFMRTGAHREHEWLLAHRLSCTEAVWRNRARACLPYLVWGPGMLVARFRRACGQVFCQEASSTSALVATMHMGRDAPVNQCRVAAALAGLRLVAEVDGATGFPPARRDLVIPFGTRHVDHRAAIPDGRPVSVTVGDSGPITGHTHRGSHHER